MKNSPSREALVALVIRACIRQGCRFVVTDVHVSSKGQNQGTRPPTTRGDRTEVKNATMVDLIAFAYNSNASKVLGGPSWLEMDHFDVIAKQPPGTDPDAQRLMFQALLAERFNLVVRNDTKLLPTYALTAGKKPQLKEADGSGETGCKPQSSAGAPGEGTIRLMMWGMRTAAHRYSLRSRTESSNSNAAI